MNMCLRVSPQSSFKKHDNNISRRRKVNYCVRSWGGGGGRSPEARSQETIVSLLIVGFVPRDVMGNNNIVKTDREEHNIK